MLPGIDRSSLPYYTKAATDNNSRPKVLSWINGSSLSTANYYAWATVLSRFV